MMMMMMTTSTYKSLLHLRMHFRHTKPAVVLSSCQHVTGVGGPGGRDTPWPAPCGAAPGRCGLCLSPGPRSGPAGTVWCGVVRGCIAGRGVLLSAVARGCPCRDRSISRAGMASGCGRNHTPHNPIPLNQISCRSDRPDAAAVRSAERPSR